MYQLKILSMQQFVSSYIQQRSFVKWSLPPASLDPNGNFQVIQFSPVNRLIQTVPCY